MDYLLVQNQQVIHLGPIQWKPRFIQSEINEHLESGELTTAYKVPPVEEGYRNLGDGFEIFPVFLEYPTYDKTYQELSGPFWVFTDNLAIGTYTPIDRSLSIVKNELLTLTASVRYKKEVAGLLVTVQNQQVFLDTARDNRNIFVQKYMLMGDTDTTIWKFPEIWLTLTKSDLGEVIMQGATFVQTQFDWEQAVTIEISSASTIEALKAIIIDPIVQPGV